MRWHQLALIDLFIFYFIVIKVHPKSHVGAENNDATYTSDESLNGEQLEKASMFSSSYDSDEEEEEELAGLDVSISSQKRANAYERLFSSQISSNLDDQAVHVNDFIQENREHEELHHEIGAISDSLIENEENFSCWPLGSLLKNPFVSNRICLVLEEVQSIVDKNEPILSEGFEPFLVMDGLHGVQSEGKSSFTGRNYNLGANPILTKAIWPRNDASGDEKCIRKQGFLGSFFDFSSVITPSGNFSGKFSSVTDSSLMEKPLAVTYPTEAKHLLKANVRSCTKTELNSWPSREVQMKESARLDVSGGAQWTGSLCYSSKDVERTDDGNCWYGSDPACEMPLDLVMYKCIVQEVLLQYPLNSE